MKIKVFEAFAGYGSQMMALRRVARHHAGGADFQLVGWSEIDDNAIAAHNAVFPEYAECNHGDISKVDWERVSDFDLFTYSFPCQDISNAGLQRGLQEGSGSRSSLLWECRGGDRDEASVIPFTRERGGVGFQEVYARLSAVD